jgi:hypothetical protein
VAFKRLKLIKRTGAFGFPGSLIVLSGKSHLRIRGSRFSLSATVAADSAKYLSFLAGLHPFKYAPLSLVPLTSSRIAFRYEPKEV